MENLHILQPLTTTTTAAAAAAYSRIILRLVLVLFIAIVSIWANYEESKGFAITVVNDAGDTPAGRRFSLLFLSNDKATRIVLKTSGFAEKILFPDDRHPKKPVDHVIVRLSSRNLTHPVVVSSVNKTEFVLHISPSVMEETNVEKAMILAVQRAMARVWLWDGQDGAPSSLLDGMVEYINILAGLAPVSDSGGLQLPESDTICWEDKDPVAVAHFLNYCEGLREGFIGRLNRGMQDQWNERTVDDALGLPSQQLCVSYYSTILQLPNSFNSTSPSLSRQVI
ncbi:hypothetical protein HHK36_005037 [Tetracentron sinense]|uniref:Plant basic secretory protein (BSP) family protein n=1 Tax=Tetracentron sinense TaxID=13715 RepID=A0A834ZUS5_TETSI|nr:hypothetical protein HHK36_005037 [Tetracentron sinense]